MPPKQNFCHHQYLQYIHARKQNKLYTETKQCAQQIVQNFVAYYNRLAVVANLKQKPRKTTGLISAQSYLSRFKKLLREKDSTIPKHFLQQLKLSPAQNRAILTYKNKQVHQNSINIPSVNGVDMIRNCLTSLEDPDPYKRLISLACLTGRRVNELLITIQFNPPQHQHSNTHVKYWSSVTGILKQRADDPHRVIRREIPLLAPRTTINKVMRQIRVDLNTGTYTTTGKFTPHYTVTQANVKYGKQISRKMRKYCDVICNIHQFRKFYALVCYEYFNENHCSLPRLASDYLGHKNVSGTILTYLNFRVVNIQGLNYQT